MEHMPAWPGGDMKRTILVVAVVAVLASVSWLAWLRFHERVVRADVLVVGAGISGLSAAYEAGYGGARVAVAEMSSVFGGNAVMSEGGLFIVDTPLQDELGFNDSTELAERDMLAWGEDSDPAWVRTFIRSSRSEIYDWLSGLGVEFTALRQQSGNHVPRFHENLERGLGITRPIYRECLRNPNIQFYWNTRIEKLLTRDGVVTGAAGVNLRTGGPVRFEARAVVLATGGFQGNERLVREHWHEGWPQPGRLLLGATPNSDGAGLQMGVDAGGATHRLDHQWHYPFGVPDPRFPGENRAVSVRNLNALWINAQGERFVNEWMASRYTVEAVVRQKPATYWLVFDAKGVDDLRYSGTDWADVKLATTLLVDNPSITKRGATWAELAHNAGLPADRLEATVARYNRMVEQGEDADFHRFGKQALKPWLLVFPAPAPRALATPPFYAMQAFAMTRKNMGGLKIDLDCRVLDARAKPIPGLFAVGEVAGLGGVNGRAGLEGTFLGPSIVQGRRAGRFVAAAVRSGAPVERRATAEPPAGEAQSGSGSLACRMCHTLPMGFFASRSGFWHFGRAHRMANDRGYDCRRCHGEIEMLRPWRHRIDRMAELSRCGLCHLPPVPKPGG
jgi:predicted oxidoreductase